MHKRPAGGDSPDQTPEAPWEGYTADERARLRKENAQLRARIARMRAVLNGLGADNDALRRTMSRVKFDNERLRQAGGESVERVQRVRSILRERRSRKP